ncbi:FAD-dependent oxidoreductase [Romboutsia sp. 1001216sp1]|nr:FAD-dependent oxidoreductase [Romboutsia sp. 1001216sp1]MDB8789788.1 FAD-dependent oxidoreductase [Romboutsia sp. 1001216sp1]MDB8802922.1 FAD-dependent oxidoreductase [Romboutsia sp. 1001216sp1]MDB8814204.1 FAD-dependent oxidoreductase [Romboutsia sp. 1001216sp1]
MDYVILGASAAGISAAKTLRELDKEGSIVIVSKDDKIYSRCMLHHVISNHRTVEEINFVDEEFMKENNIIWVKGTSVKSLDTNSKKVILENQAIGYNKLLIATGASAFIPPIKNLREANNVYPLRDIEDAYNIKDKVKKINKVAIIGAGLVGIDALVGLLEYKNIEVSLVNTGQFILNKQLDKYSASTYEKKFIENGGKLYQGVAIKEIVIKDNKDIVGILLEDGTLVECEMIIVATGVRPNADFIKNTNISYDKGIVISDKCETTQKDVYAAGDVVGKNAIWPIAVKQGLVSAYNMYGKERLIDDSFAAKNSMNFMGIATVSLGMVEPIDESYEVAIRKDNNNYKKFIYKDNVIYGAIVQGDISYIGTITYLIKNKIEIENLENRIFDIGYADFLSLKENGEFCYNI